MVMLFSDRSSVKVHLDDLAKWVDYKVIKPDMTLAGRYFGDTLDATEQEMLDRIRDRMCDRKIKEAKGALLDLGVDVQVEQPRPHLPADD